MDKYKVSHVIMKHIFGKAGFNGKRINVNWTLQFTMYDLRFTIIKFVEKPLETNTFSHSLKHPFT